MIADEILNGCGGAAAELNAAIGDGKNVSVFGVPFARAAVTQRAAETALVRRVRRVGGARGVRDAVRSGRQDGAAPAALRCGDIQAHGGGRRGRRPLFVAVRHGGGNARIAVVSASAFLQRYPAADRIRNAATVLEKDAEYELSGLRRRLIAAGYKETPAVAAPGEFSLRGDILDVWGAGMAAAVRAEFFGDTLEELRTLDESGRSVDKIGRALVKPFSSVFVSAAEAQTALAAMTSAPAPIRRLPSGVRRSYPS